MKRESKSIRPCEKKGVDSSSSPSYCECFEACEKFQSFLLKNSEGTLKYNISTSSNFLGCKDIEDYLIKNNLIRYELREELGLEILFEGLEKIESLEENLYELDRNFETSSSFSQSSVFEYSNSPPSDLNQSFLLSYYHQGFFNDHDDLKLVASCLIHEITDSEEIKTFWPKYTEKKFAKAKDVIWARVIKKMPWWAIRFNKVWEQLTEAQKDALNLEWFDVDSEFKNTQEEKARELNISLASYQERLQFAYKKIEKLYPELKRIKRRKKATIEVNNIPSLFEIENDEKFLIEHPKKKLKVLTSSQKLIIKNWAKETTTDQLKSFEFYKEMFEK